MSRGLGERQRQILAKLAADPEGRLCTQDLLWQICRLEPSDGTSSYATRAASFRRALASLKRLGLVDATQYWPHMQGRPNVWEITNAGRAAVR